MRRTPKIPNGTLVDAGGQERSSSRPATRVPAGFHNTLKRARVVWPVGLADGESVHHFLAVCHEIGNQERSTRRLRAYLRDQYLNFSREFPDKDMSIWLMKARITYWLQRCQSERDGVQLSNNFWRNYDAAMEGRVEQFDDDLRGILRLIEESEKGGDEMATNQNKSPVVARAKAPTAAPKPAEKPVGFTMKATAKPTAKTIAKPAASVKPTASTKPAVKPAKGEKTERKPSGPRQQVHGIGVCAFVRAMGKMGFGIEAAMKYLDKKGVTASRGTVSAQLNGGKVGRYGEVPKLDPKVAAELKAAMGA